MNGLELPINLVNKTINVMDLFNLTLNISNVNITNFDIPQTESLIELHDHYLYLNLKDLCVNVSSNYSYIMDPPILADIGNTFIDIDKLSIVTNLTGDMVDDEFLIQITKILVDWTDLGIFMDGYSDISVVITNLLEVVVDKLGTVAKNFINDYLVNLSDIINWVLSILPSEIVLPVE